MTSLYELSVENYIRIVGASLNVLRKAEAHFLESAQNPDDIMLHKLAEDMFPFPFQVYLISGLLMIHPLSPPSLWRSLGYAPKMEIWWRE